MPGLAGQIPDYRGVKIVTGAYACIDLLRTSREKFTSEGQTEASIGSGDEGN